MNLKLLSFENREYGARALLRNVKQLALQVRANQILSLGSNKINTHWRYEKLNEHIHRIESSLGRGKISKSIAEGERALLLAKESLNYFRQYQRNRFILYLTLMWFGWVALLFLNIAGKRRRDIAPFKLLLTNLILSASLFLLLIEYIGKIKLNRFQLNLICEFMILTCFQFIFL